MIRPQKVQLMKECGLENSSGKETAEEGVSPRKQMSQPVSEGTLPTALVVARGRGQISLTGRSCGGGKILETASARSTLEGSRCCEVIVWWTQSDDVVGSQSPTSGIRQR